jgi:trk system potassium uptake protein TrkH
MHLPLVSSILGLMLLLFSGSLLPPLLVAWIYDDGGLVHFATTLTIALVGGLLLWAPFRRLDYRLRTRDGFVIVTLFWVVMGLLYSLPFVFGLGLGAADAVFESFSGFTTTGATVITGLDALPPSILFFRQEIQWFGGIGFVVSAVALLPMLGIGGMQLFKAETPGPMKDEKLTPRIAHTARALWRIYAGLTAACAVAYWVAGMSAFDAIAHALTTLSTGGFSTHDASMAFFASPLIEAIAVVFMLAGGINFAIHFVAWQRLSLKGYWRNVEARAFLGTVLVVIGVTAFVLVQEGRSPDALAAIRLAAFTVVSVITSTGFGVEDFSLWPAMLPVLLILVSFMGACSGSTTGGMKTIRFVILSRQATLEVQRLVHPALVRPLKLDGRVVPPRVVEAVWGFFAIYIVVFALFMLTLMAAGMDQVSAFGAVATCLNNLGPGLGEVATTFASVDDATKWLMSLAMLLGRLEIFTVLVLLAPAFWRR